MNATAVPIAPENPSWRNGVAGTKVRLKKPKSAVSMLQKEGKSVTRTARHHAFSAAVSRFPMMCLQLKVIKTM